MATLWDTTVASGLKPRANALDYVLARAAEGTAVRVASAAVLEIAYGHQRMSHADPRHGNWLTWFSGLLACEVLSIIPLDGSAALVAGRLRGVLPHPPTKRDRRSKTMRQASWLIDIEIAATAFAAGLDVATANRRDFEVLRAALVTLFPGAPPMAVVDGPLL
jgi:predicted nucleic acid-binding protein